VERLSDRFRGYAVIKTVGAEPTKLLDRCAAEQIDFWGAYPDDDYTIIFRTRLKSADKALSFAAKCCCEAEILERRGGPVWAKRLRHRYVLWIMPLILIFVLVISSFFIWRIDITGNKTVSNIEILNALKDSGVGLGSYWPSFTSDSIRSRVLAEIPELKWISVSVFGSRAQVVVRERTDIPAVFDEDEPVKLIAKQSGIIEKMNIFRGYGLFRKGQTAAMSDTLIAGAVPSTFNQTIVVHAEGSVIARTWYEQTAIMPLKYSEKVYTGKEHSRFAIIFGNNRINFYRSSRISDTNCDNIIEKNNLGINGLFELPISLVREKTKTYELVPESTSQDTAKSELEALLRDELKYKIGDKGEVLQSEYTFCVSEGFAVGTLRSECRQDIAEEKKMTDTEINEAQAPKEEKVTP
jgi:similar to stage IV sporulation protein